MDRPILHFILYCHRFGRRCIATMNAMAHSAEKSPLVSVRCSIVPSNEYDRIVISATLEGMKDYYQSVYWDIVQHGCGVHDRASGYRDAVQKEYTLCSDYLSHSDPTNDIYITMPHPTHTIFMDADLIMPIEFIKDFASALALNPRGYCSAFVKEIDHKVSEKWIQERAFSWHDVAAMEQFVNHKMPYRYDQFKGAIGHFQCIPTGLCEYPERPADWTGITYAFDKQFAARAIALSEDKRDERRIGTVPMYHLDHPLVHKGIEWEYYL